MTAAERNHFALSIFDEEELADVFGARAIGTFGFDVHTATGGETIEIVDKKGRP